MQTKYYYNHPYFKNLNKQQQDAFNHLKIPNNRLNTIFDLFTLWITTSPNKVTDESIKSILEVFKKIKEIKKESDIEYLQEIKQEIKENQIIDKWVSNLVWTVATWALFWLWFWLFD